jgi:hypothetical protein
MPLTRNRPDFPGALNLCDIRPGVTVQRRLHGTSFRGKAMTIVGEPYMMPNSFGDTTTVVKVRIDATTVGVLFLDDAGVVPYSNGTWNDYTYLVMTSPVVYMDGLRARNSMDFFLQLNQVVNSASLKAPSGATFRVRVPFALREFVPAQQVTTNDGHNVELVHST